MPIHLYAEHLINIRALSLQAILLTQSNKETKAVLSADGSTLTLSHEGETVSIKLPVHVGGGGGGGGGGDAILTIPAAPTKELSFRIKLEEKQGATKLLENAPSDSSNIIPWTAQALSSHTEIRCKTCDVVFSPRSSVAQWKDLPSEGWAEMMEFWHCHKPNEEHHHTSHGSHKGYTAGSKLATEQGVGLVDIVSILLTSGDCQNLTVLQEFDLALGCSSCGAVIGNVEQQTQGFRLSKSQLSISTAEHEPTRSFDEEKWPACSLLSAIDNQGVRKFEVTCKGRASYLLVWVFSPDLMVSSSAASSPGPLRVLKVMWKDSTVDVVSAKNEGSLDRKATSIGTIELSKQDYERLHSALQQLFHILPPNAQKFQDWNATLMRRFTKNDLTTR